VGEAAVSEKHCGFVINKGGAKACDIKRLMDDVVRRVYENSGVTLEPEVKMIGEF
jgi:UDP-N-acetylmuramate dehydrogenase